MIMCSNTANIILKKVVKPSQLTVTANDNIYKQWSIDPNLATPARELYVFTSQDIHSTRDVKKIKDALQNKHVDTRIMYINKDANRNDFSNEDGIDVILEKPSTTDVEKALADILEGSDVSESKTKTIGTTVDRVYREQKSVEAYKMKRDRRLHENGTAAGNQRLSCTGYPIVSIGTPVLLITQSAEDPTLFHSVDSTGEFHPTYPDGTPIPLDEYGNILDDRIFINEDGMVACDENGNVILTEGDPSIIPGMDTENSGSDTLQSYDQANNEVQAPEENSDFPNIPNPTLTKPTVDELVTGPSAIVSRIGEAGKVADINILLREMQVSDVIKDLMRTNSTYSGIEEKLKAIQDTIYAILHDRSGTPLSEKYNKIRAIMHDKAFYNASGNTLIEQITIEIVDMIVTKSIEINQTELDNIERAIKKSAQDGWQQDKPALLAGLADERASLTVKLYKMTSELDELMRNTDVLISDVENEISSRVTNRLGDADLDEWFVAHGAEPSDGVSLDALKQLFIKSAEVPEKFRELKNRINAQQEAMRKLYDIEDEIAEATKLIIERMQSKTLDDKVICQSLLKKSLNIFVGSDNTGKTIIPYLYAKTLSKQNCNVLLVNICENDKFASYNITPANYDTFVTDMESMLNEFTLIKGKIANDPASAQQFISVLLKAIDFYKYVYVVMDPEQADIFNVIAPDVFSINYIVDTNPEHIEDTRKFIDSVNLDNVLERIFINRCNISIKPILQKLGKFESIDYQICRVEDIPEITDGSLTGFDPYGISSVSGCMNELLRHTRTNIYSRDK